ncbi:DgyrCDS5632 [Dimorphilus gyrociliatus]|uniref:Innexin n=1 Tax=Dimorphilus gyrociliatus TaxID=2664684 RepID=A0A7I8VQA4_9ANNE|nr:DgyrCDS5632 [Dimorphilus gyrociliatus]
MNVCRWQFLVLCFLVRLNYQSSLAQVYIGGIFDNDNYINIFKKAIEYVNYRKIFSPDYILLPYVNKTGPLASFESMQLVCEQAEFGVIAIVGPISSTPTAAISPLTSKFEIPQLAPAATNPLLSRRSIIVLLSMEHNKDLHRFLIRMLAPDSVQSAALIDLVSNFEWTNLAILTSDTDYGINGLIQFQEGAAKKGWKIASVQQFSTSNDIQNVDATEQLQNIKNIGIRVIILNCLDVFGEVILKQAENLGMTENGWAWIVTDGITGTNFGTEKNIPNYMRGLIGTRPSFGQGILNRDFQTFLVPGSINAYSSKIADAVLAVAYGLHKASQSKSNLEFPKNLSCNTASFWEDGQFLLDSIKRLNDAGISSSIQFNENGGPLSVQYDIVNMKLDGWNEVGTWTPNEGLHLRNRQDIRFHGGSEIVLDEISHLVNRTIRVVSIREDPFVMHLSDDIQLGSILTPNNTEGYCIDLLERLSKDIGFKYHMYNVPDGNFGAKDSKTRQWNGMVKELVERKADMAVASLTISYVREKDIDFTKPYLDLGATFVMKTPKPEAARPFKFLDPFTSELWLFIVVTALIIGIYLSLIDKLSPFARHGAFIHTHGPNQEDLSMASQVEYKKFKRMKHEATHELNATNATWFSIASLLQQGGEIYPTSLSGRITAVLWWMLVVIIVSTYTANLAAFLTASRTKTNINSIEDLAAQSDIKYGTVVYSAPYQFLMDSQISLYKDMANTMTTKKTLVSSTAEGFDKARKENFAFIWDSAVLEYAVEQEPCHTLRSIDKLFGLIGYGFGLQKSSPYQKELSAHILRLREAGYLEELKNKWFVERGQCGSSGTVASSTSSVIEGQLDIDHMSGVFYIIYGGIVLGLIACVIEWLIASLAAVDKYDETKPQTLVNSIKKRLSRLRADFSVGWLPPPVPWCCPKSAAEFEEHVFPPSRRMSKSSHQDLHDGNGVSQFRLSSKSASLRSRRTESQTNLIPDQPPSIGRKVDPRIAESILNSFKDDSKENNTNEKGLPEQRSMDKLFTILADISDARKGGGDSFSDRLSSRYTVFLLIIFSVIVTTRHIVGSPISCWCPPVFTSSHIDYTNKVCWTTNTFYLPVSEDHLIPDENKIDKRIGYYQWVSLILCCEAVFFYLPRPLWIALSKKSGIEISTLIDAAIECEKSLSNMEKTKRYIIKIARTDYTMYGLNTMSNIIFRGQWGLSKTFPRVTMCDFNIRIIGNVQRHIVQCTLPINMFNEKIFLVIWFWLVFVAIVTAASLILSLMSLLQSEDYVKTRLITLKEYRGKWATKCNVKHFSQHYLRSDGLFILRILAKNTNDLLASEILIGLWKEYQKERQDIYTMNKYELQVMDITLHELSQDPATKLPTLEFDRTDSEHDNRIKDECETQEEEKQQQQEQNEIEEKEREDEM